ncbi:MAG: ABC transporter substrate-binding protein [Clostridiales Family XIII bacterium]|nr:ABC transporter substrate-binding protein [Clostridiales Family XIII bacterium]
MRRLAKRIILYCLAAACALGATACGSLITGLTGSVLKVACTSSIGSLNPLYSRDAEALQALSLIYEPLVSYDAELGSAFRLAQNLSLSEDGLTATYSLRENIVWHDGTPFTADDVVWTYSFIKGNEGIGLSEYLGELEAVAALDAFTVVMGFSRPQAFSPAVAIPILPRHIWEEIGAEGAAAYKNEYPVGTGPMVFQKRTGSRLSLSKNPVYYGEEPGPDQIVFTHYRNEGELLLALRNGKADIAAALSPEAWESLRGAQDIERVALPSLSVHVLGFNVSESEGSRGSPLLRDRNLRQALGWVLNRRLIVSSALSRLGSPGSVLIPDGMPAWQYALQEDEFAEGDVERAKSLLDESGYANTAEDGVRELDGQRLEFRLFVSDASPKDADAARIFAEAASRAGISIDISIMDDVSFGYTLSEAQAPDFDLFITSYAADYPDPSRFMGLALSEGARNAAHYANPDYDALYERQAAEMDREARKGLLDEMQRMAYMDAAMLPIWYPFVLQAFRTDSWTGYRETPGGLIFGFTPDNYLKIRPAD